MWLSDSPLRTVCPHVAALARAPLFAVAAFEVGLGFGAGAA
jgi:hypothetical protein